MLEELKTEELEIETYFDLSNNIFYCWRPNTNHLRSKESSLDPRFILHLDQEKIVAVTIIDALHQKNWSNHLLRKILPLDLVQAIDQWIQKEVLAPIKEN